MKDPNLKKLTEREHTIRNLLIHRRTPETIARLLNITVSCVHAHVTHIRQKMGHIPGQSKSVIRTRIPADVLTACQRQVITLRDRGKSYREIAAEMHIGTGHAMNQASLGRLKIKAAKQELIGTSDDPMFQ